jgi:hypothetical protein
VEAALAASLARAAEAGRFEVVAQLARELELHRYVEERRRTFPSPRFVVLISGAARPSTRREVLHWNWDRPALRMGIGRISKEVPAHPTFWGVSHNVAAALSSCDAGGGESTISDRQGRGCRPDLAVTRAGFA